MAKRSTYTNASELAEYVYCRRAWWLHRIRAFSPQDRGAFARGGAAHTRHGVRVGAASRLVQAGYLLIIVGALLMGLRWLLG